VPFPDCVGNGDWFSEKIIIQKKLKATSVPCLAARIIIQPLDGCHVVHDGKSGHLASGVGQNANNSN
jgi:hypothetical protein